MIAADNRELVALAQASGVDPEKMAAAFNDPERFFDHLTLEELSQVQEATVRLQALAKALAASLDVYTVHARGFLSGLRGER